MYKFRINNENWAIEMVEPQRLHSEYKRICNIRNEEFDDRTFYLGYCDYLQHKIAICNLMCEEEIERTLSHELAHCWLHTMGRKMDMYTDEEVCDIMYPLYIFVNTILSAFKNDRLKEKEKEQAQIENPQFIDNL